MINEIIKEFDQKGKLSSETIEKVYKTDNQLALIDYLKGQPNREMAIYLLKDAILKREDKDYPFGFEDLMFASLLVAIHKNPEDSLLIWKAKTVDFDTYCGHDIQLIAGGGVNETLTFLKNCESKEAKDAYEYFCDCIKAGDFDDIETYFSERPWFL